MNIHEQYFSQIKCNWKVFPLIVITVLSITLLVLGVLGLLNIISSLNVAGLYFTIASPVILAGGICFILIINKKLSTQSSSLLTANFKNKKPPTNPSIVKPQAIPLNPEEYDSKSDAGPEFPHVDRSIRQEDQTKSELSSTQSSSIPTANFKKKKPSTSPSIVAPQATPLNAEEYGFKCDEGPGFPLVDRSTRQKVIDRTKSELSKIKNSSKKKQSFVLYLKDIQYVKNSHNNSNFFPEKDVLQTPVLLQYDQNFAPIDPKNYFYMHSSPAPKPQKYKEKKDYEEKDYLAAVEVAYFNLLKQQVLSGAEHILTNYWGMGAFIRNYYKDHSEMYAFRLRIAQRLSSAFCKVVDAYPSKNFTFYIGGPTGESFDKQFQAEPRDNFNALVLMFSECDAQYKKRVVFCPETDIFVKGQTISDGYVCKPGQLAPVSATNATDPHLFGNRWFDGRSHKGFNAEFAIEENAFRRSPFLCYIAERINSCESCMQGAKTIQQDD